MVDELVEKKYTVKEACAYADVSTSGYYKYRKHQQQPTRKQRQDQRVADEIVRLHIKYDQTLGYRRMRTYVNRALNTNYSRGYIQRLMQELGLRARIRRKKQPYKPGTREYIEDNLLQRNFHADAPNEKWLTDITEFHHAPSGKIVYYCAILDCYDKSIVAHTASFTLTTDFVLETVEKALQKNPGATPILHSDRGTQYTSIRYRDYLKEHHIIQSMSRPGQCLDNAVMENLFGILKTERFYDRSFATMEELMEAMERFIQYYNYGRLQEGLDCQSPMEFRDQEVYALI